MRVNHLLKVTLEVDPVPKWALGDREE